MNAIDPLALATAVLIVATLAAVIIWGAVVADRVSQWWAGRTLARLRAAQKDETPGQSSGQGSVTVEARQAALRLHSTHTRGTEQDARSL